MVWSQHIHNNNLFSLFCFHRDWGDFLSKNARNDCVGPQMVDTHHFAKNEIEYGQRENTQCLSSGRCNRHQAEFIARRLHKHWERQCNGYRSTISTVECNVVWEAGASSVKEYACRRWILSGDQNGWWTLSNAYGRQWVSVLFTQWYGLLWPVWSQYVQWEFHADSGTSAGVTHPKYYFGWRNDGVESRGAGVSMSW